MDRTDLTETGRDPAESPSRQSRASFLSDASRLLASSLDYETTLATVAGMALPHLGAWCFVDVQELARRLEAGWPPERDDPFGIPPRCTIPQE